MKNLFELLEKMSREAAREQEGYYEQMQHGDFDTLTICRYAAVSEKIALISYLKGYLLTECE